MSKINGKPSLLKRPESPAVAVDAVLFSIQKGQLDVLLIKICKGPYQGKWALPGGLVRLDETLDEAAKRVLFQKTNVKDVYLEQLYSFGALDRDTRGRSVSVAYFALVSKQNNFNLKTTSFYSEISWKPVKKLPKMAFDHQQIIKYATDRLKAKIGYTNIVYSLLPTEFTLTELQKTYEIILGQKLDKRNFRKKMMSFGLVTKMDKMKKGEANRPAWLYRFIKRELKII